MTRDEMIEDTIRRAIGAGRKAIGIDKDGRGGELSLAKKRTKLMVKLADVVQVCVEGEPWKTLPVPPAPL